MNRSTPGLPVHQQLPESTQTHVHPVDDVIQPSHPLPSLSLPAFSLSQHQGSGSFSSEKDLSLRLGVLHIRWPKYWGFSFSVSPSNEYSGLISFSIDWFDLFAVQETLNLESSPTSQFKSINSSALSFLYGPTITSIHDYWENHSFGYTDLCRQSNVSSF